MSKTINLAVEKDHIESLTRSSGMNALSELIWNSLDADASEINISFKPNTLGGYEYITIEDNGHGLDYIKAQKVFGNLGGSEKKYSTQSPQGRQYHGKEGKGRYKSLALGDLITFTSTFKNGGEQLNTFDITFDRNHISSSIFSDLKIIPKETGNIGFKVEISNINNKQASEALQKRNRIELEQRFASYYISYPTFSVSFNGTKLDFNSVIKKTFEKKIPFDIDGKKTLFLIKIIEWNFNIEKKKTYLCNYKGIPFNEDNLGIRSSLPISIFIQSDYIELLHRDNKLNIDGLDENIIAVKKEAIKIAREYVKNQLHKYSSEYISKLKKDGIYPYKDNAESIVEVSKRQVFDIVALQIHEFLPNFDEQELKTKQLTLSLIKEALEKDANTLRKILSEVIELPDAKREELVEILEETSLSNIIDTMTEIKNRLNLISGLEQIVYDDNVGFDVKERKHLHKIVIKETWLFGDEYTLGADDITLKNVLKAYLKDALNREDFQEIFDSEDNSELNTIPDVCLWQQYSLGSAGKENLVIELKKPNKKAGFTEKTQIESYASKVTNDARFPKDKTKWKFILLVKDVKPELESSMNQKNRKYGHIIEGDNYDVYIFSWGTVLSEAKIRHEYIKEKLNISLQDNERGLNYLRNKYKEYLPDDF